MGMITSYPLLNPVKEKDSSVSISADHPQVGGKKKREDAGKNKGRGRKERRGGGEGHKGGRERERGEGKEG